VTFPIPSRGGLRTGSGAPIGSILAVVLAVVLAFGAGDAVAAGKREAGGSATAARAVAEFWTPSRMKRAKPVERLLRRHGVDPAAAGGKQRARGLARAQVLSAPAGATASSSFDPVADPTAPGARVHGVVFFQFLFGLARCSGTSVEAPNRSVVVTAAHCAHGGIFDIWFDRRWAFVPGYRAGQRPFGIFPARWLGTTREWRRSGSPNADVAIAVVGRNERGQRLAPAVGSVGIAWKRSPDQVFDVHGYPAEQPFNGRLQRSCAGTSYLGHDPLSFVFPGPLNVGVSCDVTAGASGGGWTTADGRLNSVTSYGYEDDRAAAFGPYFGAEVARLYRRAARVR